MEGRQLHASDLRVHAVLPRVDPWREELAHFVDCVRSRKKPVTDGANGLRVLRVLDACQRSIENGGHPVRV